MSLIRTEKCIYDGRWHAIDDDRYDGAEDGDQTTGYGKTEREAVNDLLDKYEVDCRDCNGAGEIQEYDTTRGHYFFRDCRNCGGTGRAASCGERAGFSRPDATVVGNARDDHTTLVLDRDAVADAAASAISEANALVAECAPLRSGIFPFTEIRNMSINETSALWDAYVRGWDAALRIAALSFEGADRDAILAHLKNKGEPQNLKDRGGDTQ